MYAWIVKLLSLLLAVSLFDSFNPVRIEKRNKLINTSREAYLKKDYVNAIKYLEEVVREYGEEDPKIYLNLAHGYFRLNDLRAATFYYNKAARSEDKKTTSKALQQLGVLARNKNDYTGALKLFKEALKTDFSNETARYNYELMKKVLDNRQEKKKVNQDQESDNREQGSKKEEINFNPNTPEKTPQNESKPEGDQEQESLFLNREQAQTLLESIRRDEIRYIQQIQRKSTRKLPPGAPER